MKIVNWYILKQLLVSFVVVIVSMVALIWLMQSLKLIDMIVTKGVSVGVFLKMTFYVLPSFIQILSPLALFAVVLFVYARMQSDKELMVMRAAGMDNGQLMKPALMLAGALTALGFLLTMYMIPQSYTDLREMKWKVRNNLSHLLLQEGQFNSFKNGSTIYIKERLPDGQVKGVLVYENKGKGKSSTMVAEEGTVFQDGDGMQVVLNEGIRQEVNQETGKFSVLKFDKYTMVFDDEKSVQLGNDPREFPFMRLINMKKSDAGSNVVYRKSKVEALKRVTQPFYNFTFVFLALCGALVGFYNRRGSMMQVNTVVGLAVLTQSLAMAFENLSSKNLWFMPLMFLNVFLPILIVYLILVKEKKFKFPWVKMVVGFAVVGIASSAFAVPVFKVDVPKVSKDQPVNFEADDVSYDQKTGHVIAQGNVVVEQQGTTIKTKKIIYDRDKNEIVSNDPVVMTLPDGSVTKAKDLQISGDMKQALANAIEVKLYEGSTISATSMERKKQGVETDLKNIAYTPCDKCEGESPLWQLRAKEMLHDNEEHTISFWHTFLEAKDVPIFYFPYLRIPDFTVKRKTGFLAPVLSSGRDLGTAIGLPFFVDVADNQNLTITPVISFSHAPLGMADYEGLFTRGKLTLSGSVTQDNDNDDNTEGHLQGAFTYEVNDQWRLNGEYFRVSNDTYFRRYVLPDIDEQQPFLYSNLTAERFGDKNYLNVSVFGFQNLRTETSPNEVSKALPMVDFMYQTDPFLWDGLYAFTNINSAMIDTKQSLKSDRISVEEGIRLPYISPWGMTSDFVASVRGDGYYIDSGNVGFLDVGPNDSYTKGRLYPNVSLELGYPMSYVSGNISQVFEPIVMGVWSTNSGNFDNIPNFDSLDFDFDDTNLFARNRFSGYDRVETGARINYGAKWSLYDTENRSISALFGQSYRFHEDDNISGLMGLDDRFSDYVGRVQVDYKDISLAYRFRLAQDDFSPVKNEITLSGGRDPFRVSVDYLYLKESQSVDYNNSKREEIYLSASSKLSKQWSATGYYRYDLTDDGGPLEGGFALRYDNECTAVMLELQKSFAEDKDYKGDTSVMLKFILKTLGGTGK